MKKIRRIHSNSKEKTIDIIKDDSGAYFLQEFACKYDPEEEVMYEVRVSSIQNGKYGDLDNALKEAKRILEITKS